MEIAALVLGGILVAVGFVGCVAPVLPGPPLAYVGLLVARFVAPESIGWTWALILLAVVVVAQLLDYVLPIFGAKRFGATSYGVWGSVIGMLVGIPFVPPIGMAIGTFAGAAIGELIAGKSESEALRAGLGTFIATMATIVLKLVVVAVVAGFYVAAVWNYAAT
jgi:hypothetical protein